MTVTLALTPTPTPTLALALALTLALALARTKVMAIRAVLFSSGRSVLVSDVDVVWIGDPTPLLAGKLKGLEDLQVGDRGRSREMARDSGR